jgi:uncharacterized RDD family membrane protein YckC
MSEPNYAGFWRRCLASLLDNLVWVLFYLWIYVWIVGGASLAGDTAGIVALLVFFSPWFNYFAICEWRWGQTIGKNATGTEVRSLDGAERLTYGQASIVVVRRAPRAATTERVAPPQNGSGSRAPAHRPSHSA